MNMKFNGLPAADTAIVYVRTVAVADLPTELQSQIGDLAQVYAVHRPDGARVALVADRKLAFALARDLPDQAAAAVAVLGEIRDGIPSHVTRDLTARPRVDGNEIRERMSGNICRCATYHRIRQAIHNAADTMEGSAATSRSMPRLPTLRSTSAATQATRSGSPGA